MRVELTAYAFRFNEDMILSVLSERRAFAPRGIAGGSNGARGLNTLIKKGTGLRSTERDVF
jgi:N-methylhydantoinase B/oxoprolinase/acetone carboxylase alpha subunit